MVQYATVKAKSKFRTAEEIAKLSSGGIRRKYRDDMRDERSERPRRLPRGIDSHLDGATARPLFGLHRVARVSEHLLWLARYGKPAFRRYLEDAEKLFFEVRAEEASVLRHVGVEKRPSARFTERLRSSVEALAEDCRTLRAKMDEVKKVPCPCCHGTGRIFEINDRAVRKVLDDAVAKGLIGYSRTEGYHGL